MTRDREADLDIRDREPKRKSHRCQCGDDDMPGTCPGPDNCPYSDRNDDDTVEGDDE